MQHFWFPLVISSTLNWCFVGRLQQLSAHFIQFIYEAGELNVRRSFLQFIWLLCAWVVWNERNHRLFKNKENYTPQLLDK
jgi:hypothetical protein